MIFPSTSPTMKEESGLSPKMQQFNIDVTAYVKRKMLKKVLGSKTFIQGSTNSLLPFQNNELSLGRVIGNGEFCNVQEVSNISIERHHVQRNPSHADDEVCFKTNLNSDVITTEKKLMESRLRNKTDEKYVIKCLKSTTKMHRSYFQRGLLDLMIETKALSILSHPNIIKLRGFNKNSLYKHDYFIVLERLCYTLRDKMDEWKKPPPSKGFLRKMFERKNKVVVEATLKDKLSIFRDISSAISYMHSLR